MADVRGLGSAAARVVSDAESAAEDAARAVESTVRDPAAEAERARAAADAWALHVAAPLGAGLEAIAARAGHGHAPAASTPLARAEASFAALEKYDAIPGGHGLLREAPGSAKVAPAWSFGQALGAAIDLAGKTGDASKARRMVRDLDEYKLGAGYAPDIHPGAGATRYFDDNGWIGLDLMQLYRQTKDPAVLARARSLFDGFVAHGQDASGGVQWAEHEADPYRNMPATGSTAEFAAELYQATRDPKALAFAKKAEGFMWSRLREPDGTFADGVTDSGKKNDARYTYNQGVAIGTLTDLYQATGDETYLARAKETAAASLKAFPEDRLFKAQPPFNALYFKSLAALDKVAPDPSYRASLAGYLDRAWSQARDPRTGLFTEGGVGTYDKQFGAIDQAAFARMYETLAAWPAAK
jgi:hypothetical protein